MLQPVLLSFSNSWTPLRPPLTWSNSTTMSGRLSSSLVLRQLTTITTATRKCRWVWSQMIESIELLCQRSWSLLQDSLKLRTWKLSWLSWSLRLALTRMKKSAQLLQQQRWRSFIFKPRLTVTLFWQSSKVLLKMRQEQSRTMQKPKPSISWLHLPRSLKTPLRRSCKRLWSRFLNFRQKYNLRKSANRHVSAYLSWRNSCQRKPSLTSGSKYKSYKSLQKS